MKIPLRTMGLTLAVFFLSSCASPASSPDLAKGSATITPVQPALSAPTATYVIDVTGTPIGTLTALPEFTPGIPVPSEASTAATPYATPGTCLLGPVTPPPWPAEIPRPNEMDPETGLHMTGNPQLIDLETYRLEVTGLVDHPLSLSYDELRCMPKVTDSPVLDCPGVFVDYARWTGVTIKYILELAGVQPGATQVTMVSADGYDVNLPLKTVLAEKNFLAYELDGKTLPVLHGFPLRAVLPSMWGSYWIKWLVEIKVS